MGLPLRTCSSPSRAMISVPEATSLPSVPVRCALELRDQLPREPVRKRGERAIEHDARDLPVPRHRVLAGEASAIRPNAAPAMPPQAATP